MTRRSVFAIAGIAFGGMLVLCAICGGLVYFGMGVFEQQVEEAFERNAVVQKHIGSDITAMYDETQSMMLPGPTEFCYELTGPLGSGIAYADVVTVDAATEEIGYGMLKVSSGETYDLISGDEINGDDINVAMSALRNRVIEID